MPLDVNLRNKAEQAARKLDVYKNPLSLERLGCYIREVLPIELPCAASEHRLPSSDLHGRILVLLVGFSIDPLLQAICAFKPKSVVLVLNARYGDIAGLQLGEIVAGLFRQLKSYVTLPSPEFIVLSSGPHDDQPDHPAAVFRKLREKLMPRLRDGEKIILDITGGKKSMVTGAFLFGAFAGVDVSYVDFDEYDTNTRAPLGYTCRIGLLANPYHTFRLRDWERVRQLYEKYAFQSAGRLLEELIPAMNDWFSPEEIGTAKALRWLVQTYEYWDDGDFQAALEHYHKHVSASLKGSISLPTVVQVLGADNYWPHSDEPSQLLRQTEILEYGDAESGRKPFYLDNRLLAYAKDELARIDRLLDDKEDARSTLLRAVGLSEILLRARVLIMIVKKQFEFVLAPNDKSQQPEYRPWSGSDRDFQEWMYTVIGREWVYRLAPALRYCETGTNKQRQKRGEIKIGQREFLLRRSGEIPVLADNVTPGIEKELRNKVTHTFLSVPKSVAEQASRVAHDNVEDFETVWAPLMKWEPYKDLTTRIAPWDQACTACGVNFLPKIANPDEHISISAGR